MLIDAIGTAHSPAPEARIVSLVPSLTELAISLGLGPKLVGRTGFCIHPAEVVSNIPKVGGTKDVNIEKIRRLAPTHLLVNIDENEKPTVETLATFVPHIVVTHPCTAQDNLALYRLLGDIFCVQDKAEELCEQLQRGLQDLQDMQAAQASAAQNPLNKPRRVLYCIWKDPWMTIAPQTYLAQMLSLIGWQAWQPANNSIRYPSFDWDEPTLHEVDQILLSTEPYRFTQKHVEELQQQTGKPVLLVDGEMLSWFGSRAIPGMAYLAQLWRAEQSKLKSK